MLKKFTLRFISGTLILMAAFSADARIAEVTPVEAQVIREKQQRNFQVVNDFWKQDSDVPETQVAKYVAGAVFLTLDQQQLQQLLRDRHPAMTFRVQMGGSAYDLELVRYEHYATNFKVEAVSGATSRTVDYKGGIHYRGMIAGKQGSVAAFSFFEHGVYGIFSTAEDEGNFVVAPNTLVPESERSGRYMVYSDAALVNKNAPACGTDLLPEVAPLLDAGSVSKSVYNTCKDLEVYYQADYRTYQSFNNDVSRVADYITYTHNVVATLYANEQIYTSIKIIRVNEASDDYWGLPANNSLNFLNKFGDLTRNNLYNADVAVLLSTKGGSMGGVAWLNGLCLPYTYQQQVNGHSGAYAFCNINGGTNNPFPTYSWDVNMIAHEIGHLVGSPHTHSCTWPGGPIDACMPPDDGNCVSSYVRSYPVGGGTIMSYCHVGGTVNFSKGFGPLPGNLLRTNMSTRKSCVSEYLVNTAVTTPSTTVIANRECTDASGVTYYYYDNNTADKEDDRIVMKVRKNGANIGAMTHTLFTASTTTLNGWGSGSGVHLVLPSGTAYKREQAFAARRYYSLRTIQSPQTAIDVMLPFTAQDTADLLGSLREDRATDLSQVYVYALKNVTHDPNPETGLGSLSSSDINVYQLGQTASTSEWSVALSDSVYYAQLRSTGFTGGALYINTPFAAGVEGDAWEAAVQIYPNPASEQWSIVLPNGLSDESVNFTLYSADGRSVATQTLQVGEANRIAADHLPAGIYFFRITGGKHVYNGTLERL